MKTGLSGRTEPEKPMWAHIVVLILLVLAFLSLTYALLSVLLQLYGIVRLLAGSWL
jgi:hypothetical protein